MKDLVSVIVPVYNVEKYLNRCIDSIINQTYKNIEIILVDDGSTDSSGIICDEYAKIDNRIKVIHKANGGLSDARNKGLDNASGNFISFIDSDDFIDCTMLGKLFKAITEQNKDIALCKFNWYYNDSNKAIKINELALEEFAKTKNIDYYFYNTKSTKKRDIKVNRLYVMGSVCRALYRSSIIDKCRFIDNLPYEDLLFNITLISNNSKLVMCVVNDYLYNYSVRLGSLSRHFNTSIIHKCQKFLDQVKGYCNDSLFKAVEYIQYMFVYTQALKYRGKIPYNKIKKWNTRNNYLHHKKYEIGFMAKFKSFLFHYRFTWLLRVLYKIKG